MKRKRLYFLKNVDTDYGFFHRREMPKEKFPATVADDLISKGIAMEIGEVRKAQEAPANQRPLQPRYYGEAVGGGGWYVIKDMDGNEVEKVRGKANFQDRLEVLNAG